MLSYVSLLVIVKMLCTVIVAYFAASSVSMASAKMFWWSYQGENSTESYDPVFEICAGKNATSCAACSSSAFGDKVGAVLCESSEKLSNICYEPKKEETCCKDRHGSMCSFTVGRQQPAHMTQRVVTKTFTAPTQTTTSLSAALTYVQWSTIESTC